MTRSHAPIRSATRPRPTAWLVLLVIVVGLAATVAVVGYFTLRHYRLNWSVARGLQLLNEAASTTEYPLQLAEWERQTKPYWVDRTDTLIERLYQRHDLADPRVRALLERVGGANFDQRIEDWERWYETRQRLAEGRQPEVRSRDRVELEPQWQAPVGLTAWFTNVLPLAGNIYVPSLGGSLGEVDPYDGVVRIDGTSGAAELIFQPPDRAPHDILGLAVADDQLVAACRNGFVYFLSPSGELQDYVFAVSPIVSTPLTLDLNSDGTTDTVVVTDRGTVVAFSGRNGKTPWVTELPGGRPSSSVNPPVVQASLSAGDVFDNTGPEVIVTTHDGNIFVLSGRTGQVLFQHGVSSETFAAAMAFNLDQVLENEAPLFTADGSAWLWALVRQSSGLTPAAMNYLAIRAQTALVADLRTVDAKPDQPPWLVACTTGAGTNAGGTVCALDPPTLQWRNAPGGIIWAAPAVADINANGVSEIIVGSMLPDAPPDRQGLLTIFAHDGHILRQRRMAAGIECPPVVADVNGDGRLEVLVADRSGTLHCFGTPGPRFGRVEWGVAGGDSHNTRNVINAFAWGQMPVDQQWEWKPDF